jgi:spore coat polysaccharide biosynthesis protein SpsF
MRIVAIIQARTGATRLPNKVLSNIEGKTMLERVVTRVQRSKVIATVVATTRNPMDDAIYSMCQHKGWTVFRGDEEDVLDRFYWASVVYDADVIVRISADCPLIDPEVINYCIDWFLDRKVDYASNKIPHSYPLGLDVEVVKFSALERAYHEDKNYREHVTPYIYKNPGKFKLLPVMNVEDLSNMRWTVDTQEDLEFVRKIYGHFRRDDFNWREVVELLKKHPEWCEINKDVKQVIV